MSVINHQLNSQGAGKNRAENRNDMGRSQWQLEDMLDSHLPREEGVKDGERQAEIRRVYGSKYLVFSFIDILIHRPI